MIGRDARHGGLPASARLAWWGTAWLRGQVMADQVLDAVLGDDRGHTVSGLEQVMAAVGGSLPGHRYGAGAEPPGGVDSGLVEALARLRDAGAHALAAAFPMPGDPTGLAGPAAFNVESLAAGEAVLAVGVPIGLVPGCAERIVVWRAHAAHARQPPDLAGADRALRAALVAAASAVTAPQLAASDFTAPDLPAWRPGRPGGPAGGDPRRGRPAGAGSSAPGVPPRCVALADRALRMLDILDAALGDDGGAVAGPEATPRRTALAGLERAARHALAAACSPDAWPH